MLRVEIKANQLFSTLKLKCENCMYWKTKKCPYHHKAELIKPSDEACDEGLLVFNIDRDVVIVRGETKLITPIKSISSTKTKNLIMERFLLEPDEVEELIIYIKQRLNKELNIKKRGRRVSKPKIDPEIERRAFELLRSPQILDLFLEDSGRWVVMDETTRKIELLTCISALGDYPLNLALLGEFSTGKTKTVTTIARYFEDQDVWFLGGMSPKSLIHQKGEYDEELDAHIIDLRFKILIFLDEPQLETLLMLKPLLSRDKFETTYKYVHKEKMRTMTTILRGWPVCIFCGVKSKYTKELASRWLTCSPESSIEKIREVIKRKGDIAKRPELYSEGETFKAFKRAFQILKANAPYTVVIPFADLLATHFRAQRPEDMRFFDLFLGLIKASAILHAFQRERDEFGRLIAEIRDYEVAFKVFREIEKPTVYGVGRNVIMFYERCLKPEDDIIGGGAQRLYIYEELLSKYFETFGRPISRSQLREEYLKPLERVGLIDFEPNPDDRRMRLIAPKPMAHSSLIDDAGFRRNMKGGSTGNESN